MTGQPDEYQSVLKVVAQWTAEQRAALARALIESLYRGVGSKRTKPTADQFVGLLRGKGPPPTDQEVRQLIDEHRTRKYG